MLLTLTQASVLLVGLSLKVKRQMALQVEVCELLRWFVVAPPYLALPYLDWSLSRQALPRSSLNTRPALHEPPLSPTQHAPPHPCKASSHFSSAPPIAERKCYCFLLFSVALI